MDYAKEPNFPYSINHRRVPTARIKQELLATHGNKCAYCGIDITAGYMVIDSFFRIIAIQMWILQKTMYFLVPTAITSKGAQILYQRMDKF